MDSEFIKWIKEILQDTQDNIKEIFRVLNGEGEEKGLKTRTQRLEDKMKIHDEFKKKIDGIVWKLALIGFITVGSLYAVNKMDDKKDKVMLQEVVEKVLKGRTP